MNTTAPRVLDAPINNAVTLRLNALAGASQEILQHKDLS